MSLYLPTRRESGLRTPAPVGAPHAGLATLGYTTSKAPRRVPQTPLARRTLLTRCLSSLERFHSGLLALRFRLILGLLSFSLSCLKGSAASFAGLSRLIRSSI